MKSHVRMGAASAVLLISCIVPSVQAGTLQDENLLAGLPKGFVVGFSEKQGPNDLVEFIPADESVKDWTRMVTVQIFRSMKDVSPATMAEGLRTMWTGGCANASAQKLKDVVENGYNATIWAYVCPMNKNTGKPETMFTKITGGTDALYSVQYAYRSALTRDIVLPAMTYLEGVRVCDTRRSDRPCPAGM